MLLQDEIALDKAAGTRRLVAEYGSRLYETAICLCGNESDAEDYVFRTFEKVVERISQFKGKSSIFTWMYEIMVNIIRTDARRKGANALVFPESLPDREDPAPDACAALGAKDESAVVRAAIRELPIHLRSVVVFRFYEDMSVPEIAKVLSLPEGTVKRRLHDAKKLMRGKIARTIRPETSSNRNGEYK